MLLRLRKECAREQTRQSDFFNEWLDAGARGIKRGGFSFPPPSGRGMRGPYCAIT